MQNSTMRLQDLPARPAGGSLTQSSAEPRCAAPRPAIASCLEQRAWNSRTGIGNRRTSKVLGDSRTEEQIHGMGSLPMKGGGQMALGVERQPDRAMPEQILNDLWVRPCLQQNARRRMAQVVDADVRKPGLSQGLGQRAVDFP